MHPDNQQPHLEGTILSDFEPTSSIAGLETHDTVVGRGEEVQPGASVTAHYTGALCATGVIFQSSHDFGEPVSFALGQVIAGWTEGVPGMKVGGTRRLHIPAGMAYGENSPAPTIPPNADLVFDIELVSVDNVD